MRRIAILMPNWIGDVVMATPTIRAIHRQFQRDAEIAGVMQRKMADVLAGTPWFDRSFFCERRSTDRKLQPRHVSTELKKWGVDTVVLLPNSLWAAGLAWWSGARERVGYARNLRGPLLTKALATPRTDGRLKPLPAVDYYLELAYAIGCPPESIQTELATRPEDEAYADRIWRNLKLDQVGRVVAFNTGSAVGNAKHWPSEYYIKLARRIVADADNGVLLLCGPQERDNVARIAQQIDHPRVRSMAKQNLELGVMKACVRRSQLLVTTDSGPRHFAPAFNVPVITLFGPVAAEWSDSRHPLATNLSHPVDCRPCGKTVCPMPGHPCMRGLTVERVFSEVQRQLGNLPKPEDIHQARFSLPIARTSRIDASIQRENSSR